MDFIKKTELINQIVQELATCIVPSNWEKVIYYIERFEDIDLGLLKKGAVQCWVSPDLKLFNRVPPLDDTFKVQKLVDVLYESSKDTNEQWCGLCIRLTRDGKYATKFYYEGTPLEDNDSTELDIRMKEIDV